MPQLTQNAFNPNETVLIFDLDGTLVDSAPDLTNAMNVVLMKAGYEALALSNVRHLVGHGAVALIKHGFAHYGVTDIPASTMDRYVACFIQHYKEHIADTSHLFPNCSDVLTTLRNTGFKLAVCTNKVEELALPLLAKLGIDTLFEVIVCRDSLPTYKPDPQPLVHCLHQTNTQSGIMVGDTDTDLNAAIAADMPCLIARFGYGNLEDPVMKKARLFDSYEDLPGIVNEILSGCEMA